MPEELNPDFHTGPDRSMYQVEIFAGNNIATRFELAAFSEEQAKELAIARLSAKVKKLKKI